MHATNGQLHKSFAFRFDGKARGQKFRSHRTRLFVWAIVGFSPGRSPRLTSFWHCGPRPFSFRTTPGRGPGNHPSTVLTEDSAVPPRVWHADSQREGWSSGWSGQGCPFDFGCVAACHPASRRASASYLPLRADWAACAWALRGCARSPDPSAPTVSGAPPNKESFR